MSITVKRGISIIICLFLIAAGLIYFSRVTDRRDDNFKYAPFFEEETEYDVEFFGTSHVIYGIYPMNLWKDFGITSYNFGGHGNSLAVSYIQFENAIEYHKPKIAVLDVLGTFRDNNEMIYEFEQAHISLDAFPLTGTKIKGIFGAFPESERRLELLMPFSSYHSRWSELNGNAYLAPFVKEPVTKEKGAEMGMAMAEEYNEINVEKDDTWDEYTISMQYVRDFIDLCRKEEIEPLLIFLPDPAGKEAQRGANSVYKIAEETGTPFINFTYEDAGIDSSSDFYDINAHLNNMGAGKITDYLGRYLTENYGLKDKRGTEGYVSWESAALSYRDFLIERIGQQEVLSSVLPALYSPYLRSEIIINDESEFSKGELCALKGLEKYADVSYDHDALGEDRRADIRIYDENKSELLSELGF